MLQSFTLSISQSSRSNNRSFLFNLGSFLYKKEGQAAQSVYLSHTDGLAITFLLIDTSANRLHEPDSPCQR